MNCTTVFVYELYDQYSEQDLLSSDDDIDLTLPSLLSVLHSLFSRDDFRHYNLDKREIQNWY